MAIGEDPTFAAAWNNLGLLYLRAGAQDFAEAAWRHALTLSPADLSVMSNLAHLYEIQGRTSEWQRLQRDVDRYRLKNPYFRYWLAERALENGDYKESEHQLRIAIRVQPQDDSLYALLALVYARQSNPEAAQHWLVKAAEVATDDSHRKAYDRKLELLRAAASGG
jgi:Flp pilus assembly protein TadD